MDVDKWKSIVVPIDIYKGIKQIADMENRSISGQLRVMFDVCCRVEGYQVKKVAGEKVKDQV